MQTDRSTVAPSGSKINRLLKKSRVALYIQLADILRNRIASGEWPVGSRIPNIDVIEAEFQVARGTVRQAFEILKQEGLVEQSRAKGSFVLRSPAPVHMHRLDMDWQAIITAHEGADIETLSIEKGVHLPKILENGSELAEAYYHIKRLHRREGRVYLAGSSYLDERLYGRINPIRYQDQPLLALLQEIAGDDLGPAHQTLTVRAADVNTAMAMDVAIGSPIVLMHRQVHSVGGKLIYASEGVYRGDVVRLEMTIR